ncbi:putative adenosine monophosphate-protein transferase Fic [Paraneptunicella aestuarii]|uniref:putative adenosine monophosphate-protein transferase Fic n=1 Tax=Paraneptunicella aestuarii TaxID=2831148 RepID=UPI001E35F990|nr:putative adenosine monophosphate-protein transferase Fic [Paraneptunicella aestuarii]UAA40012.1 putative adenosine monophosphate-protein transferase Fic [Paraneptunicella aestuarii]
MDKYDASNDHYCYKGSSTLVNLLNIEDMKTLEAAEREITAITVKRVTFSKPPYSLDYMKKLHRELFSDLYSWAGQIRTVDIAKGGTRFCNCSRIEAESKRRFDSLNREDWLNGLERELFCERLAEHYCELNMIHPFREGNGRVQRLLFEHLALAAGYELNWENVGKHEWVQANIDGVQVNYERMNNIFLNVVQPINSGF